MTFKFSNNYAHSWKYMTFLTKYMTKTNDKYNIIIITFVVLYLNKGRHYLRIKTINEISWHDSKINYYRILFDIEQLPIFLSKLIQCEYVKR